MSSADPDPMSDATSGLQSLQVTSGILFALLALWLIGMNSGSVLAAQEASREKRLNMACAIIVFVSMFSSFFNFFQLTELDDVAIPQSDKFVLDMSRPFEWICTCPLMQLVLVILGGTSIPSYRCVLMPLLSLAVLLCGVASTLTDNVYGRAVAYIISSLIALIMFYFNFKQIGEVSSKDDGVIGGTSEFKVATWILILTWFPFPIWYLLSPEGLDVIDDLVVIHVGWAFLNVLAKFSFIIYTQKMKRDYDKELQANTVSSKQYWTCQNKSRYLSEDEVNLEDLVQETLTFLGIRHSVQKLMDMLKRAMVRTCEDLDKIDQITCHELLLPPDVIYAVQQRLRARRNGATVQTEKKPGNSMLAEAVGVAKGPGDISKLSSALGEAEKVGADSDMMSMARSRVEDLKKWQAVKEHMAKSIRLLIDGNDLSGLRDMLDMADAAGFTGLVNIGKAHVAEQNAKAKKASKFITMGNTHIKNKSYFDALEAYDQALQLAPNDAKALLNRSVANRLTGNWVDAEQDASRSLALRPNCAPAHRSRALALTKLRRFDEAIQACDAGLALDPKDNGLISARKIAEESTLRSAAREDDIVQGVEDEMVNIVVESPTRETTLGSTTSDDSQRGLIRI